MHIFCTPFYEIWRNNLSRKKMKGYTLVLGILKNHPALVFLKSLKPLWLLLSYQELLTNLLRSYCFLKRVWNVKKPFGNTIILIRTWLFRFCLNFVNPFIFCASHRLNLLWIATNKIAEFGRINGTHIFWYWLGNLYKRCRLKKRKILNYHLLLWFLQSKLAFNFWPT